MISLDTNYRAAGWSSPDEAAHAMDEVAKTADVVFATFDDEAAMHGCRSVAEAADRLVGLGIPEVVVKSGADGARIIADGRTEDVLGNTGGARRRHHRGWRRLRRWLPRRSESERARQLDEQLLHTRRQTLGENHPDTLTAAHWLAVDLSHLGEHEQARALAEDTLARRRRTLGPDHPDTLSRRTAWPSTYVSWVSTNRPASSTTTPSPATAAPTARTTPSPCTRPTTSPSTFFF